MLDVFSQKSKEKFVNISFNISLNTEKLVQFFQPILDQMLYHESHECLTDRS